VSLRVYVLSRSRFDADAFAEFLQDEGTSWKRTPGASDTEEIVEVAGRVCYMSYGERQSPRDNANYVKRLIQMGHESVLEHAVWGFLLVGVSRAFTHQLVRHRVGFAFSQLSQQYFEDTDPRFVKPSVPLPDDARTAWNGAMETCKEAYLKILNSLKAQDEEPHPADQRREIRRAIHSAARSVLPNATETKIFVTANARALRYFFSVRGSIPGDGEMRAVAAEMLSLVKADSPALFFDFETEKLLDGSPTVIRRP
jgi:thymidylate synthase (FAD)